MRANKKPTHAIISGPISVTCDQALPPNPLHVGKATYDAWFSERKLANPFGPLGYPE